ncbi:MAG: hypothetical protein CL549_15675 [Alcanivorax sp.]|nr:hypothetical protein [Alcanivorax sp.]MAY11898.1 hypothetical protein [Alcanivorax sp.]MBI56786.1 hypothetical protein [Alcanivorax sp.]MBM1145653.1 hypothetical protein [Alcanivorax sp. ZXX171]|tara:strand:+ start:78 stop:368 length:291 start_codon:yes stop_codon:yes gene_type:complete
MTAGLRTWDENGVLDIDVTRRLTRYMGSFTTGTSNGSYTINNVPAGSDIWIFVEATTSRNSLGAFPPEVKLNGATVSWQFPDTDTRIVATVHYGIY